MRLKIIIICEDIIDFILKYKHLWAKKRRATFFWIHPFYLIKSVVISGAIKHRTDLGLPMYKTPTLVSAFIIKCLLKSFFKFSMPMKNSMYHTGWVDQTIYHMWDPLYTFFKTINLQVFQE